LTIGQYLQPTPKYLPVVEYITPETGWRKLQSKWGFFM